MITIGIIACALAGAGAGAAIGGWYGFEKDTSDIPLYPAFTMPAGAAIGAIIGAAVGAAILT